MKRISSLFLSALMIMVLAVGCSKSAGDDAPSLLRTVPADAASVAVINIEHTVNALGGKIDGGTVRLSDRMLKVIDQSASLTPDRKDALKEICSGESGVSLSSLVIFSAARTYVSGLLDDPDKFVEFMRRREAKGGAPAAVSEEGGAKIIGSAVVLGNQFWLCENGTPDVEQLKYYQQLNEKQSYAGSDAASLLLEDGKVMTFVADINRSLARMPDASYLRMGSALVFDDMAYVAGSANFEKQKFIAKAAVLNSDMQPAGLLLPVEKIDPETVKSMKGAADCFFAVGLSPKLTRKLADMAADAHGLNMIVKPLQQIDGTLAVRADASLHDVEAYLQTTGKNFSDFSFLAQNMLGMTVTRDGDKVAMVKGDSGFTGKIAPDEAARRLKGAWIGLVAYSVPFRDLTSVILLSPHKGSLMFSVEVDGGVEPLLNALL